MRLYQVTFIDDDAAEGSQAKAYWSGTQTDVREDAKRAKREMMRNVEMKAVDVPVTKAALLAFLNERNVV